MAQKRKQVLLDHKKVGKRLIPPFLQHFSLSEVKWINTILPELLWLAFLNKSYSLKLGAKLALELSKAPFNCQNNSRKYLQTSISSFSIFSLQEKNEIIEHLKSKATLQPIRDALAPLIYFYPECPLSFLFEATLPNFENPATELNTFKLTLSSLFNRTEISATYMQANAVYIAFATGILVVKRDLAIANFTEIIHYPKTEESKRIAASVRGMVSSFFGEPPNNFTNVVTSWPKYFWNRGLELESCEFNYSESV